MFVTGYYFGLVLIALVYVVFGLVWCLGWVRFDWCFVLLVLDLLIGCYSKLDLIALYVLFAVYFAFTCFDYLCAIGYYIYYLGVGYVLLFGFAVKFVVLKGVFVVYGYSFDFGV